MKQPFRHRARSKLDDRERRPSRSAELDLGRRLARELDELGEPDAPCCCPVPQLGEVGDRGDPDDQPSRRERPVATTNDNGRADILLPQDLERRGLEGRLDVDELGSGHQPMRIRAAGDVTPR